MASSSSNNGPGVSSRANLAQLPTEILWKIVFDPSLDKPALKVLRLTNKLFESVARARLFQTAYLSRLYKHHDNFFHISENQHLALCVKELVWISHDRQDNIVYPDPASSQTADFRKQLANPAPGQSHEFKNGVALDALLSSVAIAIPFVAEQRLASGYPPGLAAKLGAMQRLIAVIKPELELAQQKQLEIETEQYTKHCPASRSGGSVTKTRAYSDGSPFDAGGGTGRQPGRKYWLQAEYPSRYDRYPYEVQRYLAEEYNSCLDLFHTRLETALPKMPNLHTLVMDEARFMKQLTVFDLGALACVFNSARMAQGTLLSHYVLTNPYMSNNPSKNIFYTDVQHLTSLTVYADLSFFENGFYYFLSSCVNLEEVTFLRPYHRDESPARRDTADKLLKTMKMLRVPADHAARLPPMLFPRLRSLHLVSLPNSTSVLYNFIASHKKTLRRVRLDDCRASAAAVAKIVALSEDVLSVLKLSSLVIIERGWDKEVKILEKGWLIRVHKDDPTAYKIPSDFAKNKDYFGKRAVRVFTYESGRCRLAAFLEKSIYDTFILPPHWEAGVFGCHRIVEHP